MNQKEITERVRLIYLEIKKRYEAQERKLTNREFFRPVSIPDSTASSIISPKEGGKPIYFPKSNYEAFIEYWNISRDFFYHGEGEMFNKNTKDVTKQNENFTVQNATRYIGEIFPGEEETNFRDLGRGQLLMLVPVVDVFTMAGYLENMQDREYVDEMPTIDLIVDRKHRGKYLAFKVKGDSMSDGTEDSIPNNSTVIGRWIDKELWRSKLHTHDWDDYIIVHKSGTIVKRVIAHDTEEGTITIHSLNEDKNRFPDEVLYLDDIYQMFNVIELRIGRRK